MIRKLYVQVLIAVLIGVLLGHFAPALAITMKPLGDGFIRLIRMLIAPLIFCTVVLGIAGMADVKKIGRAAGLALVYFEVLSSVALVIGLVVGNLLQPGAGMNVDVRALDVTGVTPFMANGGAQRGIAGFLAEIIPSSIFDALARGDVLQVLVFATLFGFALQACGGRGSVVFMLLEHASQILFRMIAMIMRLAPVGAFGAMAFTVGAFGIGTLKSLLGLLGSFYLTCVLFVLGVLGLVARAHGFRIWALLRYLREELLIVLGTSSSESVLARLMARLESLGVARPLINLIVPTGYSFNLDGTAIYLTLAVLFVAQATHTPLGIADQLLLLLVLLITSKGAAGVTGSGFIVLAATLQSVGPIPVAGLALILGVDRFMSEARALTNVIGNAVAALVIARWTGELDTERLRVALEPPRPVRGDSP